MKKLIIPIAATALLLTGCGEKIDSPEEIIQKSQAICESGTQLMSVHVAAADATNVTEANARMLIDDKGFAINSGFARTLDDQTFEIAADADMYNIETYTKLLNAAGDQVKITKFENSPLCYYDGVMNIAAADLIPNENLDTSALKNKYIAIPMEFIHVPGYTKLANIIINDISESLAAAEIAWTPVETGSKTKTTFKLTLDQNTLNTIKTALANNSAKYQDYIKTNITDKSAIEQITPTLKALVAGILDTLGVTYTDANIDELFAQLIPADEINTTVEDPMSTINEIDLEGKTLELYVTYVNDKKTEVVSYTICARNENDIARVNISMSDTEESMTVISDSLSISEYLKIALETLVPEDYSAIAESFKGMSFEDFTATLMSGMGNMSGEFPDNTDTEYTDEYMTDYNYEFDTDTPVIPGEAPSDNTAYQDDPNATSDYGTTGDIDLSNYDLNDFNITN